MASSYTKAAKALERCGPLATGGGYYFQSITPAINNDGDTHVMLDALAKQVGVLGSPAR